MQVAIIGAGSFGTVLADIAAHNECDVRMYARREEMVGSINNLHRNPRYHPELELHESILASGNLSAVVSSRSCSFIITLESMDAVCQELAHVIDLVYRYPPPSIRADGFKLMSQVLVSACLIFSWSVIGAKFSS